MTNRHDVCQVKHELIDVLKIVKLSFMSVQMVQEAVTHQNETFSVMSLFNSQPRV